MFNVAFICTTGSAFCSLAQLVMILIPVVLILGLGGIIYGLLSNKLTPARKRFLLILCALVLIPVFYGLYTFFLPDLHL